MPSGTTEAEIFDCLAENLRIAAERCAELAWHPRRGFRYDEFRRAMELVYGSCRQAYYWRDYDSRWLVLAQMCHLVRERSGKWLRGKRLATPDGGSTFTGGSVAHRKKAQPQFKYLAEFLTQAHRDCERLRTMATNRIGPIMPEPLEGPHRDTRPVAVPAGWDERSSGLVVPGKAAA